MQKCLPVASCFFVSSPNGSGSGCSYDKQYTSIPRFMRANATPCQVLLLSDSLDEFLTASTRIDRQIRGIRALGDLAVC